MRPKSGEVGLRDLRELTTHLQRALTSLAANRGARDEQAVDFVVSEARVGSLALTFSTPEELRDQPWNRELFQVLVEDLDGIRRSHYRPSLDTNVLRRYEGFVRILSGRQYVVELECGDAGVRIDDGFRSSFELATREREVRDVKVTGSLDAVSAHAQPFTFFLYPKLEDAARIRCRFPQEMLPGVASLIKRLVTVSGTGYFAPIGNFPMRLVATQPPVGLTFEPKTLRAFVRRMDLLPRGMSVSEYIQRNRRAAGLEA